jgi:hypothetical protein
LKDKKQNIIKKIVFIFSLFVVSLSFATNSSDVTEEVAQVQCSSTTSSTVTTNSDGSSTRTTTTSINCDTAQELAQAHALMAALGMCI